MLTADAVIHLLDLKPHPEGGFYRETFRDVTTESAGRVASTAIYFLLKGGQCSRWHRIDAAEVWHWYAGAVLQLEVVKNDATVVTTRRLGANLIQDERPQHVVPPRWWQRARSLGDWTLVGCTVAPGFEFTRFEVAIGGQLPDAWG